MYIIIEKILLVLHTFLIIINRKYILCFPILFYLYICNIILYIYKLIILNIKIINFIIIIKLILIDHNFEKS